MDDFKDNQKSEDFVLDEQEIVVGYLENYPDREKQKYRQQKILLSY